MTGRWAEPQSEQNSLPWPMKYMIRNELHENILSHMHKKKASGPGSLAFQTVVFIRELGLLRAKSAAGQLPGGCDQYRDKLWKVQAWEQNLSPEKFRLSRITWYLFYYYTFSTTSLDSLRRGIQQFPLPRFEPRTCSSHLRKMRKRPQCSGEDDPSSALTDSVIFLVILVTPSIKWRYLYYPFRVCMGIKHNHIYNYFVAIKHWTNVLS